MLPTQKDHLVGSVKTADDKEVRVKLTTVDDVTWLNVREHILSSDQEGRGLLVPLEAVADFKKVVDKVPTPEHTDPVDTCKACP